MLTNNTRMMLQHLLVPFLYFTRQVFAIAHPSWLWKLSMEQASRIYMYSAWYADLLRTMSPDTVLWCHRGNYLHVTLPVTQWENESQLLGGSLRYRLRKFSDECESWGRATKNRLAQWQRGITFVKPHQLHTRVPRVDSWWIRVYLLTTNNLLNITNFRLGRASYPHICWHGGNRSR